MQVQETLQGVGVAVLAGTAMTDHRVGGSFNVSAEAEGRFLPVHVTYSLVIFGERRRPNFGSLCRCTHACGPMHVTTSAAQARRRKWRTAAVGIRRQTRRPSELQSSARFPRRICWGALCQCSLPTSCKVGARGMCNGKLLVRMTHQERATAQNHTPLQKTRASSKSR